MYTVKKDDYKGPEHRVDHRRTISDRRQDIRFEPDKENRRKIHGRRKMDGDVWTPH